MLAQVRHLLARPLRLRHACVGAVLLLSCLLVGTDESRADTDSQRQVGDFLATAKPLATLGTELHRGDKEGAWQFALTFAVSTATTDVLGRLTHVERPDGSNDNSFPSGHAHASSRLPPTCVGATDAKSRGRCTSPGCTPDTHVWPPTGTAGTISLARPWCRNWLPGGWWSPNPRSSSCRWSAIVTSASISLRAGDKPSFSGLSQRLPLVPQDARKLAQHLPVAALPTVARRDGLALLRARAG
ncbi:MAG: hypothetical protein EON54_02530 [Alcaligenaceae bacterium]|nr:MAG: hypothetical protein EON54_02530 [Alcaligenaceae bacterium]